MKRALVTGGAGFIGSHLVEELLARDKHVTVIDDESTGTRDNLSAVAKHPNFQLTTGSVGDRELLRDHVAAADEIYHLAAAVGVALIAREPIETIERNIYPTEILLAEAKQQWRTGRKLKIFLASTSEVYGKNPKSVWSEEDDLVFGATTRARWSYGASKAIDEFLALAYWRQDRLPIVIGRFFNVVGPRQSGAYGMVLPRFVQAATKNEPLVIHDDGQQQRCFAHVSDVVLSVLQLMDTEDAFGRVFNIGSDRAVSILELAEMVVDKANSQASIQFQSYTEAYDEDFEDVRRRVPDLSRLRQTISHRPEYRLEDIIDELLRLERV